VAADTKDSIPGQGTREESEPRYLGCCASDGMMVTDSFIRRVLWFSAAFNLSGAAILAFPSSALGQWLALPSSIPLLYGAYVAWFVVLFAGAYAWLACQPSIDRPVLAIAAIGKAGIFFITLFLWIIGEAAGRGLVAVSGDLILSGIYIWWLLRSSPPSPS
jgi:hypothetical protein